MRVPRASVTYLTRYATAGAVDGDVMCTLVPRQAEAMWSEVHATCNESSG